MTTDLSAAVLTTVGEVLDPESRCVIGVASVAAVVACVAMEWLFQMMGVNS